MASDNDKVADQVADLKTEVKDLRKQLSDANVDSLKKTITDLEGGVATFEASISEKNSAIDNLNKMVAESNTKIEELTKANADIQKELDTARELELVAKRINILVSGKIDIEKAKEDVAKFIGLSDEQFDVVAEALIAAVPVADTDDTEDSSDADATDDSDDANVDNADANLDDVETDKDEPTLAADSDKDADEQMEAVRSGLQDFVRGRLGIEKSED